MGWFSRKPSFYEVNKLPENEEKLMCFGSVLVSNNHVYSQASILNFEEKHRETYINGLAEMWEIVDFATAKETIEWLLNEGHRTKYNDIILEIIKSKGSPEGIEQEIVDSFNEGCKTLFSVSKGKVKFTSPEDIVNFKTMEAWDYERVGFLARTCCFLNYITREEAMSYLQTVAKLASKAYPDWEAYMVGFLLGRSVSFSSDIYGLTLSAEQLIKGKKYVLNKYPLHMF
ncbi:DUF1266 domain-containing protein [Paenibacillus sp. UMB4589-SE434]|uniref:DUF1266 domain-containing protein n=1 Tax=Paenibacillus sp. UMB4589-SE434 TaxID=3046314 RepID=UPI002550BF78|nr:DUF1266 domain-containing protein [Paenibacillus sp. UMB4589-SE434]MDK8180143.1 DUF1266 domain-containing protein [Paenibacillus sp. UMB4589-SE434]